MSERRDARRRTVESHREDNGIPADLALGPCVEVWADPDAACPTFSARRNWKDARNAWAAAQGIDLPGDYRHLPPELYDRGPFYRDTPRKAISR